MSSDRPDEVMPSPCVAVEGDLAELALGALTGKGRVAALAHLETCPRCEAEVDQLSAVADQLLHLAPRAEPPVGFEGQVFERLGLATTTSGHVRGRRRRPAPMSGWNALVAAVIAVVLLAAGAGLGATLKGGAPARVVSVQDEVPGAKDVTLRSGTRDVGDVLVYPGNPTWLFMYLHAPGWTGALRCELVVDQGRTITLGRFWLAGGKGAWAASTAQPAGRLSEALIVGQHGKVLAKARLS